MTLFVGLGNPGNRYENNRHNIGFLAIDNLVDHYSASKISKTAFFGDLYKANDLLFLKPTTFMNLSGKSLQAVQNFYKISIDEIVVIHDDLDLPFGAVRFKKGGGNGGHNGLKSIDALVGKEYTRIRMGIGKPEHKSQVADYVLHDFSLEEQNNLEQWIEHIRKASIELSNEPLEKIKTNYTLKSIESLRV